MEKPVLLVDVDDVVLYNGLLSILNSYLHTNYEMTDFKTYYFEEEIIKDEKIKQDFYQYYKKYNAYDRAVLLPGAYDTLKELNNYYDIIMLSACVMYGIEKESGMFFKNKFDYLVSNLNFLDPNNFIFTSRKDLVNGDVQIDDRLSNLGKHIPLRLLFTAYHNISLKDEELNGAKRVDNWNEIGKILIKK